MLEQRVLLVRPGSASGRQPIVDGDSGAPLGSARWEVKKAPFWRRLFGHNLLTVHEDEDEPLLFTIRRPWSFLPRREVRDAEGRLVGSLLGRLVQDQYGQTIAALQDGVFRSPQQRPLAELTASDEGLRIAFSTDISGEPFVKMLLLAASLVDRGS